MRLPSSQHIARRMKILEEYNKDLVSCSEEVEPDLQAAAPLLFGQSFTKQAMDHLGQVEALRKVKGKVKKVFSSPPPAKADPVAGGASLTIKAMVRKGLHAGQS